MDEKTNQNVIQLLTAKDAAQLCRLSKRSWFRFSSCQRTPPSIKIGGSRRWRKDYVERWIEWGCCDRKEFEARQKASAGK